MSVSAEWAGSCAPPTNTLLYSSFPQYAHPLPDELRNDNWGSRRHLLSALTRRQQQQQVQAQQAQQLGRALLGGDAGASGAGAGENFDVAAESECLAQLADTGFIVLRNRGAQLLVFVASSPPVACALRRAHPVLVLSCV